MLLCWLIAGLQPLPGCKEWVYPFLREWRVRVEEVFFPDFFTEADFEAFDFEAVSFFTEERVCVEMAALAVRAVRLVVEAVAEAVVRRARLRHRSLYAEASRSVEKVRSLFTVRSLSLSEWAKSQS